MKIAIAALFAISLSGVAHAQEASITHWEPHHFSVGGSGGNCLSVQAFGMSGWPHDLGVPAIDSFIAHGIDIPAGFAAQGNGSEIETIQIDYSCEDGPAWILGLVLYDAPGNLAVAGPGTRSCSQRVYALRTVLRCY